MCGVCGYSGGYKMVWRFQYYSCVFVYRHHSASVPRNALSPRWSHDCFRNRWPRRRVQLRRRTSPSSSTTCALSYPRITCSTITASASLLSPLPCSASCMQMFALTSRYVHVLTPSRSRRCSGWYSAVATALRHGTRCLHSLASCCGERSLVLSTFLHESFPPHHPRALIHPHSTRCRPTSVQSTPFHASNFRLSLLCPVSSAIPHPEPPLIRAPRTRALPPSLPSCPRPMLCLMYRHSSSLPIRTLLFRQPFYLSLSFLRFLCNLSRSPY